jgi:single-strand DNA-binding protein
MPYNKIIIQGNMGRDPEIKTTASDKTVATFSVAVSEKYQGETQTEWFNVVAWEKTAVICQKFLHKGDPVLVEGRIKTRSWDSNGEKKYRTEVIASQIVLLGSKHESDPSDPVDDIGF